MMNTSISQTVKSENIFNVVSDTPDFLISDNTLRFTQMVLSGLFQGMLSVGGVVTNTFNVVIFLKLGLNNSMSVAVFVLSLTDLLFSLLQVLSSCCQVAEEFQLDLEFSLRDFSLFVIGDIECIMYFVSCWATAFIAIERCVCVLQPFKVRQIFTTLRSVFIMSFIYFVAIATNLHMLYGLRLEPILRNVDGNVSLITKRQWTLVYSNEAENLIWGFIEYIFGGIVTYIFCQVVLLACSVLMAYGLRRSTSVRPNKQTQVSLLPEDVRNKSATSQLTGSTLTGSERKLVKVVLMLSVLMICCNVPRSIACVVYYVVDDLHTDAYQNLNFLMWEIAIFISTFITVGNFCIYMTLNTKYRICFYNILAKICKLILHKPHPHSHHSPLCFYI